jgi:biopolymer transport protein ExbD
MKCLLLVCVIAGTISAATLPEASSQTPPLQKGVSVQMADTNNATPMPEADKQDAWILAVTAPGQIYLGTQAVTADQLVDELKSKPRNRQAKLYIKADARSPYANVKSALQAAKVLMFDDAVLLTKQPESPALGMMIPPKGLDVLLSAPGSAETVSLTVSSSGTNAPELRVNGSPVTVGHLQTALNQALNKHTNKMVTVSADPQLSFAQVVHVIDAVRSLGAQVVLPTAEM